MCPEEAPQALQGHKRALLATHVCLPVLQCTKVRFTMTTGPEELQCSAANLALTQLIHVGPVGLFHIAQAVSKGTVRCPCSHFLHCLQAGQLAGYHAGRDEDLLRVR